MNRYEEFARHRTGIQEDTVIVLDVSDSMDIKDFSPSRIEAGKEAVERLLEVKARHYPGDRVGLVVFCERASVVYPLRTVGQHLASMKRAVRMVGTGPATNMTAGLEEAASLLRRVRKGTKRANHTRGFLRRLFFEGRDREEPRVQAPRLERKETVIFLGDGANNAGPEPVPVAKALKDEGVSIFVIGIGPDSRVRTKRWPWGAGALLDPLEPLLACQGLGSREFDDEKLKAIASKGPDGEPRYVFISDTAALVERFEQLGHLRRMEE